MKTGTYIFGFIMAAVMSACSSESTIHNEEDISGSTDAMRFTITKESQAPMHAQSTRATQPLTSGFMVTCYKNLGASNQHIVMPQYEVRYHTTGTAWDGTERPYWTYDDVNGQFLRFWDYSGFPYRFHAIAPYPANPAGFVLTDTQLTIPAPYSAQTCHNGMLTPSDQVAEPYIVAQVHRATDGKDCDLLATDPDNTLINNNSTTKSRDVWMPFHHLNSKIRFGIFHTTQWMTAYSTYIEHLTVSVTSTQFATKAKSYSAQCSITASPSGFVEENAWRILSGNAGFKEVTTIPSSTSQPYQIFRFDGGSNVEGNDMTVHQTRKSAYFMQCPDGMVQIPQEDVQMIVSFDLMNADGTLYQSFRNVPVRLELDDPPGGYDYTFDWRSGYIYTYYLVIGEIEDKLEITFTATLTPWEDVSGSLSTDLEQ